ncbi:MAG: response regulator [Spirochaetia bacterium]|nr:response regulator [Spirochaetia bacterium]
MEHTCLKILLVDDERISREVAAHLLQSGGHTVVTAGLPSEAIALFKKEKETLDIIVLDMLMPEMSGKELFFRLKEIDPGIRTILLSGYGKNTDMQEALDHGVYRCLQKPVTRQQLLDTVREVAEL